MNSYLRRSEDYDSWKTMSPDDKHTEEEIIEQWLNRDEKDLFYDRMYRLETFTPPVISKDAEDAYFNVVITETLHDFDKNFYKFANILTEQDFCKLFTSYDDIKENGNKFEIQMMSIFLKDILS